MWDASNEPDLKEAQRPAGPGVPTEYETAAYMANVFHELDPKTPVTIGMATVPRMGKLAASVDVLQFHDYRPSRAEVRAAIARARQFARKVGKPVVDGEIGCIARANPYDVTLQEHMNTRMGWYIWELMMVRKGWGMVHGVYYEDGTVRDPSIVAALLGLFPNRGSSALPSVPDQEGWVTRVVTNGEKWLAQPDASWDRGLDLAEQAANLLEGAQLVAMREPPTRQVDLMRQGQPDLTGLSALLREPHHVVHDAVLLVLVPQSGGELSRRRPDFTAGLASGAEGIALGYGQSPVGLDDGAPTRVARHLPPRAAPWASGIVVFACRFVRTSSPARSLSKRQGRS